MATEQQVKAQVAEMRQALESARASARTGGVVRVLGVIVGLVIVGIYVWVFLSLIQSVVKSKEMETALTTRLEGLQRDAGLTQDGVQRVLKAVQPTLVDEAKRAIKDAGLESWRRKKPRRW